MLLMWEKGLTDFNEPNDFLEFCFPPSWDVTSFFKDPIDGLILVFLEFENPLFKNL